MNEINTKLLNLPTTISAYTVRSPEGDYTICLNARISTEQQMIAYRHEYKHIDNNDFEKHNVQEIEANAHK